MASASPAPRPTPVGTPKSKPAALRMTGYPADAMLEVGWSAVPGHNIAGQTRGVLLLRVGNAMLRLTYPTLREARHQGAILAARLGQAASSRSSLMSVGFATTGSGPAIMWSGRILVLATTPMAQDVGEEAADLASRWATALRQAAATAHRATSWPRQVDVPVGGERVVCIPSAWKTVDSLSSGDPDVISAHLRGSVLVLKATAEGSTSVTLHWGDNEATIAVRALPHAGSLPSQVSVSLVGRGLDMEVALHAVGHAVEQASRPARGASLSWYWQAGEGGLLSNQPARITAWLEGDGLAPVSCTLLVQTQISAEEFEGPRTLAASNEPERIEADGKLADLALPSGNTQFYFHHQNDADAADRMLTVRLENRSGTPLHLLVAESGAGPSRDELYAGHLAAWRYLRWKARGCGWHARIPPHGSYCLDRRLLHGGDVGCGMGQVQVLEGPPPALVVEALSSGGSHEDDDHGVPLRQTVVRGRGVYPEAEKQLQATYEVGGMYAFILIGGPPYQRPLGDGTVNTGNYGVTYQVSLHLHNPTTQERRVWVVFEAPSGVARGSLVVDGRAMETPVLGTANREYGLVDYTLAAGETRDVQMSVVPEPGSNYPVRLIAKPLPPNQ